MPSPAPQAPLGRRAPLRATGTRREFARRGDPAFPGLARKLA